MPTETSAKIFPATFLYSVTTHWTMNPTKIFKIQGCQLLLFPFARNCMLTEWFSLFSSWTSATGAIIMIWQNVCIKLLHLFFFLVYCIIPSLGHRKQILLIRSNMCCDRMNVMLTAGMIYLLSYDETPLLLIGIAYPRWATWNYIYHVPLWSLCFRLGLLPAYRRLLGQMCACTAFLPTTVQ